MQVHLELGCRSLHPLSVLTVNNINQAIRIVEVVTPQRTKLLLTSNIPHSKENILVLNLFHIETYSNGNHTITCMKQQITAALDTS